MSTASGASEEAQLGTDLSQPPINFGDFYHATVNKRLQEHALKYKNIEVAFKLAILEAQEKKDNEKKVSASLSSADSEGDLFQE